jgi:hypothetical protein
MKGFTTTSTCAVHDDDVVVVMFVLDNGKERGKIMGG